ncbi:MAG: hypothetical protein ABIH28_03770 [archaeon]
MSKGLFSVLKKKTPPKKEEKRESMEDFKERYFVINEKLGLLSPEKRERFREELRDIIEHKSLSARYGAKDPVNLPPSDVLTIKENLYKTFYSS